MKLRFKRIISSLTAFCMVISLGVSAFATNSGTKLTDEQQQLFHKAFEQSAVHMNLPPEESEKFMKKMEDQLANATLTPEKVKLIEEDCKNIINNVKPVVLKENVRVSASKTLGTTATAQASSYFLYVTTSAPYPFHGMIMCDRAGLNVVDDILKIGGSAVTVGGAIGVAAGYSLSAPIATALGAFLLAQYYVLKLQLDLGNQYATSYF